MLNGDLAISVKPFDQSRKERSNEPCVKPHCDLADCWSEVFPKLSRFALSMGLSIESAEDVLQDVYLEAIKKLPEVDDQEHLRRWLFRVTANRCRLYYRRQGRWQRFLDKLSLQPDRVVQRDSSLGNVLNPLETSELSKQVQAALGRLTDIQRETIVLRYFAQLDSKEIGRVLSIPDATVRGHLRKARLRLAVLLDDHAGRNC